MKVIKRDGRAVEYNSEKIGIAIEKANKEVTTEKRATAEEISKITQYIECMDRKRILVEDIQDIIEQKLMEIGKYELAKKYIVYRYTRALVRKQNTTDETILGIIQNSGNLILSGNTNLVTASVQRNLIAAEVSKDLTKRILLPEKITKAHEQGILYFHATDYFLQPIINSCFVNIEDMLDNGTNINGQDIESPKSFQVACIVTTQIIAAIASSQYGEQYINVKHLGKYLRKSYNKLKEEFKWLEEKNISDDIIEAIINKRLQNELAAGVQTIEYQINTLVTNYGKSPIVTLILELDKNDEFYKENKMIINEILKQRYENIKRNNYEICNYSKLIYCINNCEENDEDITEIVELTEKCGAIQNCDNFKAEGSFNQGVVTINLLQVAKNSCEDSKDFWNMLDERLELCYEALMCRHYALLGTISDISPIHWQNGAIARLKSGEKIDVLLKDGYSNITLGYYGLNETTEYLKNKSEDSLDESKLQIKIIKYLEDKAQKWKKMTGLGFIVEETKDDVICKKLKNSIQ